MAVILTPTQVAAVFAVKVATVHQWTYRGKLPLPMRPTERHPLWELDGLLAWAAETGQPVAHDAVEALRSGAMPAAVFEERRTR